MRSPIGVWFYLARGCSDFAWNAGRTLLAKNRCDAALSLQQLNASTAQGSRADNDSNQSRVEAAKRVVDWLAWSNRTLGLRNLPYESHRRVLAGAVSRASAWLGRETDLEETLIECARGLFETPRQCSYALHPNASLYGRSQSAVNATISQPRAAALTVLAGADVLDFHNHAVALDLRRQGRGLDTVAMWQQPMGGGSIHWHPEIWDVRFITERRPPQRNSYVSASNYAHRSDIYGWSRGWPSPRHALRAASSAAAASSAVATSPAATSPPAATETQERHEKPEAEAGQNARVCAPRSSFASCKACNQSRLELHCHFWSWADTGSAYVHYRARHERVADRCKEIRGNGSVALLWPE